MTRIEDIKDRWTSRLDLLVSLEEYELAQKTKDLIDKIDYFVSLRDKIKDQGLYKEVEQMVIEQCQILYCGYKSRPGFKPK